MKPEITPLSTMAGRGKTETIEFTETTVKCKQITVIQQTDTFQWSSSTDSIGMVD